MNPKEYHLDIEMLPKDIKDYILKIEQLQIEYKKHKKDRIKWEIADIKMELIGSINASYYGNEISKSIADYLRNKYNLYY